MSMNDICKRSYQSDQEVLDEAATPLEGVCHELSASLPRDVYLEIEEKITGAFVEAEKIIYARGFFSGALATAGK